MLELKPGTKVARIVFVGGEIPETGQGVDWLGHVFKQEGEPWKFEYRWRYHVDDKAFDSEDPKSWYLFSARDPNAGPDELVNALMLIATLTAARYGGEMFVLEVNGTGEDAQRMLADMPWIEMRTEEDPGDGSTEAQARAQATGGRDGN